MLTLTATSKHLVVERGWYTRMHDYFEKWAIPGMFEVAILSKEALCSSCSYLRPDTCALILGDLSLWSQSELCSVAAAAHRAAPQIAVIADRCASSAPSLPFESGVDLIIPDVRSDGDRVGIAAGVVVGRADAIARIRDIRGQIGTIASDAECVAKAGVRRFNSDETELTAQSERLLAELEQGERALVFRSGMAAISCLVHGLIVRSGRPTHLIVGKEGYRQTLNLLDRLSALGVVEVTAIPMDGFARIGEYLRPETAAVFFETPSNPFLNTPPVELVSAEVRRLGSQALVIVDSTFATPVNQKALTQGADLVVPSLTKYIGGDNTVAAGAIIGSASLVEPLRDLRRVLGTIASDRDCKGVIRGIQTLKERMSKHNRNGLYIAQLLERSPLVRRVWYPGLRSHPDYQVASTQMPGGFGGVVTFRLYAEDLFQVGAFVDAFVAELPNAAIGPSFGGNAPLISVVTVVSHFKQSIEERLARGITHDLIRLSVGTGDVAELERALSAGFAALRGASVPELHAVGG